MYNSTQKLPETIFFESFEKIDSSLNTIDVSVNTQQEGIKILPNVSNTMQTSVLKFDIVHDILLQQRKFCEQSVFKTRLVDDSNGKESRSNKQGRIERMKQLFSVVEKFKETFFESAPIAESPYIDDEKKMRQLVLPRYTLKDCSLLTPILWQKKVQDFVDDNYYAINCLPKILHPMWFKSMLKDLSKEKDEKSREMQAQNCLYYLLYHNNYLHMKAIDGMLCHYMGDKEIDEFDVFTSINQYAQGHKLLRQELYVNYLLPIVSEQGQSKIHIRHQAQLIKQLQQQLLCQTGQSVQKQHSEELKKAKLLLMQYKTKNNQLEKENGLLREDIRQITRDKERTDKHCYELEQELDLLKQKFIEMENSALQSQSLDKKGQCLLQQNYQEMKNSQLALQQKIIELEDKHVRAEKENLTLRKLLTRSNTLPDLRKPCSTHQSQSMKSHKSHRFYGDPEQEENGYFARNFTNSPEEYSPVEHLIGTEKLIFKTNQKK